MFTAWALKTHTTLIHPSQNRSQIGQKEEEKGISVFSSPALSHTTAVQQHSHTCLEITLTSSLSPPLSPASCTSSASSPAKTLGFSSPPTCDTQAPLVPLPSSPPSDTPPAEDPSPPLISVALERRLVPPPEGFGVKAWLLRSAAKPSAVYMPAVAVCQELPAPVEDLDDEDAFR